MIDNFKFLILNFKIIFKFKFLKLKPNPFVIPFCFVIPASFLSSPLLLCHPRESGDLGSINKVFL